MKTELTTGNLATKFGTFEDHWHPRQIAELNGQAVKIAKVKGAFTWHAHDNEDEMFFVIKGKLSVLLREGELTLYEGDYAVIPRGVEHKPVAEEEAQIMMFEPVTTINTGNQTNEFTKKDIAKI